MEEEYRRLERDDHWNMYFQKLLDKSKTHSVTAAEEEHNQPLNRYINVKAYDRSRIKLSRTAHTDYINANEVTVPRSGRRYILTQGPLQGTIGHFWLMIWEQKSSVIVMLNKIIEMDEFIKCEQYWPDEEGQEMHFDDVDICIKLDSTKSNKHYIVRNIILTDKTTSDSRKVTQFHYTAWPDHDEPKSPVSFLRLLSGVRKTGGLDKPAEPAVVHCSAGIGRSGTFCLIDSVMTMIENQATADNIDIGVILVEMRDYRMGLIQTAVQLRFAYKSIIYGIKALEKANKLRPHASKRQQQQQQTNGSPINGPRRISRIRKRSSNSLANGALPSLLVDALEDADSDSLEEAFDRLMLQSPTLKKQKSDSPLDLDKILIGQISENKTTRTSSSSSQASAVLVRRLIREKQLAEKTNEIKRRMKAEELKKETRLYRMELLKKSVSYSSIVVAVGSIIYALVQAGSSMIS